MTGITAACTVPESKPGAGATAADARVSRWAVQGWFMAAKVLAPLRPSSFVR